MIQCKNHPDFINTQKGRGNMADNKNDLPKVPPFIIKSTSGKTVQEPASQPRPVQPPTRRNDEPSQRGMLSVLILIISVLSLGVSLLGGAWVAIDILARGMSNQVGLFPKILAIGLAYMVGWVVSLFWLSHTGKLIITDNHQGLLIYCSGRYLWSAIRDHVQALRAGI